MNLNQYADFTETTGLAVLGAVEGAYPLATSIEELFVTVTGLSGELGEVMEHLKKRVRDGKAIAQDDIMKEMGDLLFYWARLCNQLGLRPSDVIKANVEKITGRIKRGTQRGSGDHR